MQPHMDSWVLEQLAEGQIIILEDKAQKLAYFAIAASKATADKINFMSKYGRGIITMPIIGSRLDELRLPGMISAGSSKDAAPFTVSVDVKEGATTGISTQDRATTVHAILDPNTAPEDLLRPGHLFPLRYTEGGVFKRAQAAEAIVDLARLAGMYPAGVLCAIMDDVGDMMSRPVDLQELASAFDIKIFSVGQVMYLRGLQEKVVERVAKARLPTRYGEFRVMAYRCQRDKDEHLALVLGNLSSAQPIPALMQRGCIMGQVFGSTNCPCGTTLRQGIEALRQRGWGVLIYTPMASVSNHLGQNHQPAISEEEQIWHQIIGLQILADLGASQARFIAGTQEQVFNLPRL